MKASSAPAVLSREPEGSARTIHRAQRMPLRYPQVYNIKFAMSIRFMLQPEGEDYWMVARDDQNAALNQFCELNCIQQGTFDIHGYLPVMCYRGTQNDLDQQRYIEIEGRIYKTYVDKHGSQFDRHQNVRAHAPLFIQKQGRGKMIARPYQGSFIDPRLRPPTLYQVNTPRSQHAPARGGVTGRRP